MKLDQNLLKTRFSTSPRTFCVHPVAAVICVAVCIRGR